MLAPTCRGTEHLDWQVTGCCGKHIQLVMRVNSSGFLSTVAVFVPVLYALGEVDSQPVRSVQGGDVLQVGRVEHSDDAVSTTTEDEVLADCQTARR